jgi:hypothetical protein
MAADAPGRYCEACQRYVHNFSSMTAAEVERLVDQFKRQSKRQSDARLCARVEHASDGRLITSDFVTIDLGWKGIASRTPALAGAALTAFLTMAHGAAARPLGSSEAPGTQQSSASAPAPQPESASDANPAVEPHHGRAITVLGRDDAPVPHATVTLTKGENGRTFVITSDEQGRAWLNGIPHGEYRLKVSAAGFQQATRRGVFLPANTTVELWPSAAVGTISVDEPTHNPFRRLYSWLKTYL